MNAAAEALAREPFAADWRPFPMRVRPTALRSTPDALWVSWEDGRESPFHLLWLRDNCPCPECVHPGTREQVFEIVDAAAELAVESAELLASGELSVRWNDGHPSVYGAGWLRAHAYDEASRAERQAQRRTVQTWDAQLDIPTFDYAWVMNEDAGLLAWLLAARDVGLTRLTGMPHSEMAVGEVARRISFARESNFGVLFEVRTKVEAVNSNAYTALELPHHTDLPTRELQPGLQFLHCLENTATGGESTFVDGFAIAEALRQQYPEDFELLSQTPLEFRNKAPQSDYRCLSPIIGLNALGEIAEIRLANWLRAPFDMPAERMQAFYQAYRRFSALTREPRFIVSRRLEAGQMWCFDNRRTMHARQAFDPSSGTRFLRGCYVDRDELLSRIRVLQRSED